MLDWGSLEKKLEDIMGPTEIHGCCLFSEGTGQECASFVCFSVSPRTPAMTGLLLGTKRRDDDPRQFCLCQGLRERLMKPSGLSKRYVVQRPCCHFLDCKRGRATCRKKLFFNLLHCSGFAYVQWAWMLVLGAKLLTP